MVYTLDQDVSQQIGNWALCMHLMGNIAELLLLNIPHICYAMN